MYGLLNMLLNSVCQNFVKDFVSMFISDIGLQFSFFVASLSGFGIRVMVASQNDFGSLPSSAVFWKSLSRISVSYSKFLVEFSCEAVWTWAFVCWKISDYRFNFRACDGSIKIFYFFLVQFWALLQNHSHQDSMVLAQRQTYRSMEQNRKPRDKSTHIWTPYL